MKTAKVFLSAIVIIMTSVAAPAGPLFAGPFLTCDDYTVSSGQTVADLPDRFELVIDGTLVTSPAVDIVTGGTVTGRRLMYDLSGIAVGAHTLIGRACNIWGCSSDSNPYSFTRSASGKPVNIRLTK